MRCNMHVLVLYVLLRVARSNVGLRVWLHDETMVNDREGEIAGLT